MCRSLFPPAAVSLMKLNFRPKKLPGVNTDFRRGDAAGGRSPPYSGKVLRNVNSVILSLVPQGLPTPNKLIFGNVSVGALFQSRRRSVGICLLRVPGCISFAFNLVTFKYSPGNCVI